MVKSLLFSNSEELLELLKEDYANLQAHPDEKKMIFDFFVRAESLLDHHLPGRKNNPSRKKMRGNEVLLQVVSHIANDAKHFIAEASHHKSILKIGKTAGWFNSRWFNNHWFGSNWFSIPEFYVDLDGDARNKFGKRITIMELSKQIIEYWDCTLSEEKNNT